MSCGVDLWLLGERDVHPLANELGGTAVLSPDELIRYETLALEPVRRRYLGGRLLMRRALSAYAPPQPSDWRFFYTRHGRPELRPNPWLLDFNLSHTDGLIACGVAKGGVCGVDVEVVPTPATVAEVTATLAPSEQRTLAELPVAERALRFTELWVLKEAYVKALGTGFDREPSSFAISIGEEEITVRDGDRFDRRWRFALVRIGHRHVCGVAIRSHRAHPLAARSSRAQIRLVPLRSRVSADRADRSVTLEGRAPRRPLTGGSEVHDAPLAHAH